MNENTLLQEDSKGLYDTRQSNVIHVFWVNEHGI